MKTQTTKTVYEVHETTPTGRTVVHVPFDTEGEAEAYRQKCIDLWQMDGHTYEVKQRTRACNA